MHKKSTGARCPWCGARYSGRERAAMRGHGRARCPFCEKPIIVGIGLWRILLFSGLAAAVLFGNVLFLRLGAPFLLVWIWTMGWVCFLWIFRREVLVLQKTE